MKILTTEGAANSNVLSTQNNQLAQSRAVVMGAGFASTSNGNTDGRFDLGLGHRRRKRGTILLLIESLLFYTNCSAC